ncbi:MAG: polyphosphate polymerase domain-containing protein [Clostridia bacterium]|nr:polyphosphate polymerase domain-containing protein [Clostridia bacterium]
MNYRHEYKTEINTADMYEIRSRLSAAAKSDPHCIDGRYFIRSLYFDTPWDKALHEKLDGVNRREKFRIRYYNGDTGFIQLEKKSKLDGMCSKQSARLTQLQAQKIVDGDILWMRDSENALIRELYIKMHTQLLKPKTVVDYTREPFVYPLGNVRVTFDYNIRTGIKCTDFLNPGCVTVPVPDNPVIMEIKWDEYIPDIIKNAIQLKNRQISAFSKYAQCRIYG